MIITNPSSNDTVVKNIFRNKVSVTTGIGCTIEYNMNAMMNMSASSITGPAYVDGSQYGKFKKLFPLDSIIKPFRPLTSGIKYAIIGDIPTLNWGKPQGNSYPYDYRLYFPGVDTSYKYWISAKNEGTGTSPLSITYPKDIKCNKVVARFEISHGVPGRWYIYGKENGNNRQLLLSGTNSDIPGFVQGKYNAGTISIYFNGTTWSLDETALNTGSTKTFRNIQLEFTASVSSSQYVAVTEFSPRWVIDISDYIVAANWTKESSSTAEDVLPVGYVTANSFTFDLNKFNNQEKQILDYKRDDSFAIDTSKIYMYKQAEVKPYFKVYHDNGSYGPGSKYDIVPQGTYYIDSWQSSEFNEINVTCLDGAKILQETIAPPILCEQFTVVAILRNLLDSIGFTNYNFNILDNDQSIVTPEYWWTDKTKTAWTAIQEICRDTQMTAVFDDNNVLQFYTRDYMYGDYSRSTSWQFVSTPKTINGISVLPNIVSLDKTDLQSINQVTVTWNPLITSNYDANAGSLWRSEVSFLSAAALVSDLNATDVSTYDEVTKDVLTKKYVYLEPIANQYESQKSLYSYNGFLVINNEIIEYDAIQYGLVNKNTGLYEEVDITSDSDIAKYRALAGPNSKDFQPNKKYRIKARGTFGTEKKAHSSAEGITGWTERSVKWQ
jgi:hypothetical protein